MASLFTQGRWFHHNRYWKGYIVQAGAFSYGCNCQGPILVLTLALVRLVAKSVALAGTILGLTNDLQDHGHVWAEGLGLPWGRGPHSRQPCPGGTGGGGQGSGKNLLHKGSGRPGILCQVNIIDNPCWQHSVQDACGCERPLQEAKSRFTSQSRTRAENYNS